VRYDFGDLTETAEILDRTSRLHDALNRYSLNTADDDQTIARD
jgi:hypothetical protein